MAFADVAQGAERGAYPLGGRTGSGHRRPQRGAQVVADPAESGDEIVVEAGAPTMQGHPRESRFGGNGRDVQAGDAVAVQDAGHGVQHMVVAGDRLLDPATEAAGCGPCTPIRGSPGAASGDWCSTAARPARRRRASA